MIRKSLMALAATLALSGAQAASFNFTGSTDANGPLPSASFSGMFSYDESLLSGSGSQSLDLTGFQLNIFSQSFMLADADAHQAYADFKDGEFLGLSLSFSSSPPVIYMVSGTDHFDQASLLYDTGAGTSGFGSYTISAVPEPESWALSLAGLAALGFMVRRKRA